jgi:hypothetical protein
MAPPSPAERAGEGIRVLDRFQYQPVAFHDLVNALAGPKPKKANGLGGDRGLKRPGYFSARHVSIMAQKTFEVKLKHFVFMNTLGISRKSLFRTAYRESAFMLHGIIIVWIQVSARKAL